MNDRVTIGQYIPGNSPVHRLDPRVKIVLTLVFMIGIFFIDRFLGLGVIAAAIFGVVLLSGVPVKRILKGLRPLIMILLFTTALNLFLTPGKEVASFWIFHITEEGIYRSVFMTYRIALLVFGTTLLTLTTSPLALTDGIEALLRPLTVIHFPAHELAMMISIALRFIPTLFEEADKIMRAQKARGADFDTGNMFHRAKAMIPLLVPLFLNAINRADDLGRAMEARCYRGGTGRTRLNPLRMTTEDIVCLILVTLFFVGVGYFL